jgi:Flp pilus assembly protein TadG
MVRSPPNSCQRVSRRLLPPLSRFARARDQRGIAALEFAFVAPLMLLIMLGILAFGFYLEFIHEIQELASSAARSSVAGLNEAERDSLANAFVMNFVANSIILNQADISVQTATTGSPPVDYTVTITYNMQDTVVPTLARFVGLTVTTITRTSMIEFGGY